MKKIVMRSETAWSKSIRPGIIWRSRLKRKSVNEYLRTTLSWHRDFFLQVDIEIFHSMGTGETWDFSYNNRNAWTYKAAYGSCDKTENRNYEHVNFMLFPYKFSDAFKPLEIFDYSDSLYYSTSSIFSKKLRYKIFQQLEKMAWINANYKWRFEYSTP